MSKDNLKQLLKELFESGEVQIVTNVSAGTCGVTDVDTTILIDGEIVHENSGKFNVGYRDTAA